jgi:hypothetical protein
MRHKLALLTLVLAVVASIPTAIAGNNDWIVFSSTAITPRPVVWQTEDWNDYQEAEGVPFRDYTFEYPKRWSFTGYSVFEDDKGRKVAEIAPGVIALSPTQKCFDKAPAGAPIPNHKAFRMGHVKGRYLVSDVVFEDSPEKLRIHSYCIQEMHYAFTIMFLERKNHPGLSSVFRHIIRSFKFAKPASSGRSQ